MDSTSRSTLYYGSRNWYESKMQAFAYNKIFEYIIKTKSVPEGFDSKKFIYEIVAFRQSLKSAELSIKIYKLKFITEKQLRDVLVHSADLSLCLKCYLDFPGVLTTQDVVDKFDANKHKALEKESEHFKARNKKFRDILKRASQVEELQDLITIHEILND